MREAVPHWLKKRIIVNDRLFETRRILSESSVATVCESSLCPNINECYSRSRATFLILGRICTRRCAFCSSAKGAPLKIDNDEAERISGAVKRLNLRHAIVTSVTRDDLPDGGAAQFVKVIGRLRGLSRDISIEVLVPDFNGNMRAAAGVVKASPDIFAHNIETVERLYPLARRGADYKRSLELLAMAKRMASGRLTKSGMMVGLGESEEEVASAMSDLKSAGCDMLTIGQYLRPAKDNLEVKRYVDIEEFGRYKLVGQRLGFKHVSSGPFVRSSYHGEEMYAETEGVSNERCYAAAAG